MCCAEVNRRNVKSETKPGRKALLRNVQLHLPSLLISVGFLCEDRNVLNKVLFPLHRLRYSL